MGGLTRLALTVSGVLAMAACVANERARDTSRPIDTSIVFQPSTKVGGPRDSTTRDAGGMSDGTGLWRPMTAEDSFPTTLPDTTVDAPRLSRIGHRSVLLLPPRLMAALRSALPDFRTYRRADYSPSMPDTIYGDRTRQANFAVIGDFDGDHRLDVALYGKANNAVVLAVVLNEATGARVIQVERIADDTRSLAEGVLTYDAPGDVNYGEERFHLAHDAFSLVAEWGSTLYYYENGKFARIVAGD